VAGVTLTAAVGLLSTGCSIRTQAPIKEIAYDFSDRDFYDRAYATSPQYAEMEPTYVDQTPHRKGSVLGSARGGQHATLVGQVPAGLPATGLSAVVVASGASLEAGPGSPAGEPAALPLPGAMTRTRGPAK
jgi:hypothetical protein